MEQAPQVPGQPDLLRRAADQLAFRGDQPERVGVPQHVLDVVGGHQDGQAVLVGEGAQQLDQLQPGGQVEERGGLVEQQDGGLLGERPRDHEALALAVAELRHRTAGQVPGTGGVQGPLDRAPVGVVEPAEPSGVRGASEGDEVVAEQLPGGDPVGEDDGQLRGELARGEVGDGPPAQLDASGEPRLGAGEGAHEGGLADAVRADEAGQLPCAQGDVDAGEHGAAPVAHAEVRGGQPFVRHGSLLLRG